MATQSERRATTQAAILDAAEKLFRQKGFDGASVEDITSAANVAKGTFYQHFETKTDILLALIRRHEAETLNEIEHHLRQGRPPLKVGEALVQGVARSFEKDRKMAVKSIAVAMTNPAPKDEPSLRTAFARIFAEAQRRGEIRADMDPHDLALTLVGGVLPVILLWVAEGKKGELAPAIGKLWRVLLEGFQS